MFFTDFCELVEALTNCKQPLLISDDFNIHLDNTANPDAIKISDILDSANSIQNVSGATHRKGHTLDIIITQRDDNLVSDVKILQDIYSDHLVITCKLNCPKPPLSKVLVSYRSTKLLDTDELSKIISKSLSHQDYSNTADANALIDIYNGTLKRIFDDLAPVETRLVNHRPWAPWYNDDLRDAILVLLDLSAAFDTLDHINLLGRLKTHFGFSGKVPQWFQSYLTRRTQLYNW